MMPHTLPHRCVALVGAGPGDPGLITVKGRDYLQQADAVVYDHLVCTELLEYAPHTATQIYVGKKCGKHIKSQNEINQILIHEALSGGRVVRLKGGDPFIFGRGSEECQALREHGILFEIVPGVSALAAVPAYAGIPITARDRSPSFLAVTGHEHNDKETPEVDWAAIARIKTTIVIFMGILRIREICHTLIQHGRHPEIPVAVIQWGTIANKQQTLLGNLSNIADKLSETNLKPPGLIVIGEVVHLHDQLHWFEETWRTSSATV
jgi:uroporphyrin-III C-methyltransferase